VTRRAGESVETILARARANLDRLTPREAYEAVRAGALLIDIRPALNRETEGGVPGAVVIERNVLEWRLDPASDSRIPQATHDLRAILLCNEGYASSLAAIALHEVGVHCATDVVGGYRAWRAAGLPTSSPRRCPG
jgi:rhodanese-related sulfurtransferase